MVHLELKQGSSTRLELIFGLFWSRLSIQLVEATG